MRIGDVVPDFELPDESGTVQSLAGLVADGPIALFFYPGAMTKGCTVEACHFRDLAGEFAALGARPVGISHDPVERQRAFADRDHLAMTLLSDESGTVAELFGVRRRLAFLPVKRTTFVIDTSRRVQAIIKNELQMDVHADRALEALRVR